MEIKDIEETKENNNIFPMNMEEDQNIPTTVVIKDFNGNFLRTDVI